jgi:hypothetical protein
VRLALNVSRDSFEDKYLGYPTPEGQMNKGKFQPSKRLPWKETKQLGREVDAHGS